MVEQLLRVVPFLRDLFDAAIDEVSGGLTYVVGEVEVVVEVEDLGDGSLDGAFLEGRVAGEHLENCAAQAPDVCPSLVVFALGDLGCHPEDGADGGPHLSADGLRAAEVRQLGDPLLVDQHVQSLDVAVDHVVRVEVEEALEYLEGPAGGDLLAEAGVLPQQVTHGAAVDELEINF